MTIHEDNNRKRQANSQRQPSKNGQSSQRWSSQRSQQSFQDCPSQQQRQRSAHHRKSQSGVAPSKRGSTASRSSIARGSHDGASTVRSSTTARSAKVRASSVRSSSAARSSTPRSSAYTLFGFDVRFIVLVLVILVVVCVLVVRGCSRTGNEENSMLENEQIVETETAVSAEPAINVEDYREQVFAWLEEDYANALMLAAQTNEDAAWIVSHINEYAVDGSVVQYKLLKLAAVEPEARSFVRNWPESYPSDQGEECDTTWEGRIPHLYQWDKRWGYTLYCNTTFALTGCCPTSMAMVYQGLTGDYTRSPYDMGVLANERGYMDPSNGTDNAFLTNCAGELGLSCWQLSVSSEALTSALALGNVLICNVGPGDFTTGGHFIVLTGLDDAGDVIVNDPYSAQRSAISWSADTIVSQTKALYAFSLA